MTRRNTHQQQSARTEMSRHLRWALQQIEESETEDREEYVRQFDFVDDAIEAPEVLVSARRRRMF